MKIPNSVRISGVDYEVKFTTALNNGTNVCYGYADYDKSLIEINPDNHMHQQQCQTLLHEILHAIAHDRDLKVCDDEDTIDALSKGLYQVLEDNGEKLFDLCREAH